jgi:hypothetical protein
MTFDWNITTESIVTFAVGAVAFSTYFLQKKDEKRKAAIIALSEIRQAESAISTLREKRGEIGDFTSVLPKSRWQENKHLFAAELDRDELDALNKFYQSCALVEEKISFVKKSKEIALEEKFRIHQKMRAEAYESAPPSTPPSFLISENYLRDSVIAQPNKPIADAIKYSETLSFVLNTTAGAKLKKMAESKIFLFRLFG